MSTIAGIHHRVSQVLWFVAVLVFSATVPAQSAPGQGKFRLDLHDPSGSVPDPATRRDAPLDFGYWLMEVTDHGTQALSAGRFAEAERFFEALRVAVPERAIVYSKLCEAQMGAGRYDAALENCKFALGKAGVLASDYLRYVRLRLALSSQLSATDVEEMDDILRHLTESGVADPSVYELSCEVGLRTRDVPRLAACIDQLEKLASGQPKLTAYRWSLAMFAGEYDRAQELLTSARQQGFAADTLRTMSAALSTAASQEARVKQRWILALAGLVVVAAVTATLWIARARHRIGVRPV